MQGNYILLLQKWLHDITLWLQESKVVLYWRLRLFCGRKKFLQEQMR
jgi:hypothetical protein